MTERTALKATVEAAMRNAFDNGHDFWRAAPEAVAQDMVSCDADLEAEDVNLVAELVAELQKEQGTSVT